MFPVVVIVCGHSSLAEELNDLFRAKSKSHQHLSYHTNYQFCLVIFIHFKLASGITHKSSSLIHLLNHELKQKQTNVIY